MLKERPVASSGLKVWHPRFVGGGDERHDWMFDRIRRYGTEKAAPNESGR